LINTEKSKFTLINLAICLFITSVSVYFARPLLEDWGALAWFQNAGDGLTWWRTWWFDVINGTPARPLQLIPWMLGIKLGDFSFFGRQMGSVYGLAAIVGVINALKFLVALSCLSRKVPHALRIAIALYAAIPFTWTSSLNPQSLSSHITALYFLIYIAFFQRYILKHKSNGLRLSMILCILLLLLTYQALLIVILFFHLFYFYLNRKSYKSNLSYFQHLQPLFVAFAIYCTFLMWQFIRLGNLGYEANSLNGLRSDELLKTLILNVFRLLGSISRLEPILLVLVVITFRFVYLSIRASLTRQELSLVGFTLLASPIASSMFIVSTEWANDPNRVLYSWSMYLVITLVVIINFSSESKKFKHKGIYVKFLCFILSGSFLLGIYFHGSPIRNYYDKQIEISNLFVQQFEKRNANQILVKDYTGSVGDYYLFFGAGEVLNWLLRFKGYQLNVTFCSPIISGYDFVGDHKSARLLRIGSGPQTHPAPCYEDRFKEKDFASTWGLVTEKGKYRLNKLQD